MSTERFVNDLIKLSSSAAFFDLATSPGRERSRQELIRLFFELQHFIKPKCFLEIGAHDASFSVEAKAQNPHSRAIAFEASPHNHRHFSSINDYVARGVEYHHLAVSDTNGSVTFKIQNSRGGVEAPKVKGDDSLMSRSATDVGYELVTVDTVTLDTFLSDAETTGADFSAWVDVEGATEKVFAGANETLSRTKSIFIEVEDRPYWRGQWLFRDIHRHLTERGFHPIARDFENAHQFNVIFVHESVVGHYLFPDRLVTYFTRLGSPGQ